MERLHVHLVANLVINRLWLLSWQYTRKTDSEGHPAGAVKRPKQGYDCRDEAHELMDFRVVIKPCELWLCFNCIGSDPLQSATNRSPSDLSVLLHVPWMTDYPGSAVARLA